MENDIRKQLMELLRDKMKRLTIKENEMVDSFDLVKSGFVNSIEFVDLVASIEKNTEFEIDFEKALERGDLTTIGGLIRAFDNK